MIKFAITASMAPGDVGVVQVGGYITTDAFSTDAGAQTTPAILRKQLDDIKGAKALEVHINSPGGEVFSAIEMRQALLKHPAAKKTVYIDGLCASAATLLACIDAPIVMAEGSYIMIHNPMSLAMGDYREMRAQADVLKSMADQFACIYAKATNQMPAYINELMDAETWLTPEDAMSLGFPIETTDKSADMMSILISPMSNQMKAFYHNVPAKLFEADPDRIPDALLPRGYWPPYGEQLRCECVDYAAQVTSTAPRAQSNTIKDESFAYHMPANTPPCVTKKIKDDMSGVKQPQLVSTATVNDKKEEKQVEWNEITLEELRNNRPDICAQIEAQAAETAVDTERKRLRAIDEAAGLSDALADRAKYEDCISAGEYALMALRQMRDASADNAGQRDAVLQHRNANMDECIHDGPRCESSRIMVRGEYLSARARETAQMSNVGHAPDIDMDSEAAELAKLLK